MLSRTLGTFNILSGGLREQNYVHTTTPSLLFSFSLPHKCMLGFSIGYMESNGAIDRMANPGGLLACEILKRSVNMQNNVIHLTKFLVRENI